MACDEDRAAPLQRDGDVVVRSVEAIQILNVVAGGYAWPLDDGYVRGELAMGHRVRSSRLASAANPTNENVLASQVASSLMALVHLLPKAEEKWQESSPIRAPKRPMCWPSKEYSRPER